MWEVVGGTDKGGIVVRAARELTSEQLPQKLATASRVTQLARVGDRLHFKLLEGQGPEEGWVSIKLKDKELLLPCKQSTTAEPATSSSAAKPSPQAQLHEEAPKQQQPRKQPQSSGTATPKKQAVPQTSGSGSTSEAPQFPVAEALQLQDSLRQHFSAKGFQDGLRKLLKKHPQRKQRGHAHGPAYFQAFETLVLTVFCKVLPKYDLRADWDGVQDMYARMATAMRNSKVKKQQEELNTLLGLPRDAVLLSTKKAEEAFVYCEARDGGAPGYAMPLLVDEDGDEAHEFFIEDPCTGELLRASAA